MIILIIYKLWFYIVYPILLQSVKSTTFVIQNCYIDISYHYLGFTYLNITLQLFWKRRPKYLLTKTQSIYTWTNCEAGVEPTDFILPTNVISNNCYKPVQTYKCSIVYHYKKLKTNATYGHKYRWTKKPKTLTSNDLK